jgi:FtsZ-binding cell division protein ZapB
LDEDRCYLMEIEQLKRENNFLKKKIAELSKRHPALTPTNSKRKSFPSHIKPAEHITALPQQNYVVGFFEEVTRLLESFSALFRLDAGDTLKEELAKETVGIGELSVSSGEELSRKLGRMLLEPEGKRYGALLGVFEEYYRESTERSRALRDKVEQLTTSAIELGKQMAERVRTRERVRGSRIFSAFHEEGQGHILDELSVLKSSFVKSTCTDSLDLSGCRQLLGRDKMFENIF